jgi:hypothetical protein
VWHRGCALAKGREKATVLALENALDTAVAAGRQMGCVESVTRGKAVVHTFRHRFILRGHQAGGLRCRQSKGVFEARGVQL